jgi:hypothetical protein
VAAARATPAVDARCVDVRWKFVFKARTGVQIGYPDGYVTYSNQAGQGANP